MANPLFQHLGIVGVGLIGGSVGAAVRQRHLATKITGLGRSAAKLQGAVDRGILDAATEEWSSLGDCDFVFVATPVDRIVADVVEASTHCPPGCIVTDAGSVKGSICNGLPANLRVRFVGSHPLAGSEKNGFAYADADLFDGRTCVVTPTPDSDSSSQGAVEKFWRALGMRVLTMSPEEHDRRLARTSHLPHLAAAALSALLESKDHPLAATGFRDTTRIAAGDPELWRAIFEANSNAVRAETDRLIKLLTQWKEWMDHDDWNRLTEALLSAKQTRDAVRD